MGEVAVIAAPASSPLAPSLWSTSSSSSSSSSPPSPAPPLPGASRFLTLPPPLPSPPPPPPRCAQGARPGAVAAAAIVASCQPRTMAETLSTATSYTEDDFYCPVCQEVFKTPVRTAACQHVFCRKCFLTAMRESGIHCPLCRGNVTRRERACPERALDIENVMRKFSGSCRCCAKQIKFYRMRHHYKSCKKYQDEYGVSSIIPNFQISQDSVGNRYGLDTKPGRDKVEKVIGARHLHLTTQRPIKEMQVLLGIPHLSVPCVKKQTLQDNVYWIIVIIVTSFR
ncbi:E3 ubiquitin-protein ligase RNF138 isoform X3 [Monodelphis domestica]|uniref:E3 ubiquitin-protein ligase RNF138 isoform X3 n=1 Tax=Monodelphis domestica TaxID=13616 RepID=UPI0024E1A4AF|nr:E3 ubiquitin-protein ligase RNF138 isoform X3 [Monodelphis domestica]